MKKCIVSALVCASLLIGLVPGAAAVDSFELAGSARIEIDEATGYTRGFTDVTTADDVRSQFAGDVTLTAPDGKVIEDSANVPSDTVITAGSASAKVLIPGDVNRDGRITVGDAIDMLKLVAQWDVDVCEAAADVDRKSGVTVSDAILVLKYVAGWDITLADELKLVVLDGGDMNYAIYEDDTGYGSTVAEKLSALTGKTVQTVKNSDRKFIFIGKNLYTEYGFISEEAVKNLSNTDAFMCVWNDNFYLTANSDNGMLGAINFITSLSISPELDLSVTKGYAGTLGDRETLVTPKFTTLEIPGIKNGYRFLHLTDSHITTIYDDEENETRRNDVAGRLNNWIMNMYRKPSYLFLDEFFGYAEDVGADRILMTGDITDSPSKSNLDIVKNIIDDCTVPTMYTYGNHDWRWNDDYDNVDLKKQYKSRFAETFAKYQPDWSGIVDYVEYDDLMVVSVDNSNYGFDARTYNELKSCFEYATKSSKPVILMLHIPFHTEEMHPTTMENWPGGGALCMGDGGTCDMGNRYTKLACDMITAESSPVAAILAGHVHFDFETMVNGRIPQIVTASAFDGHCRVIDVVPAAN